MSLCILPSVDIFPALAFEDDISDVFDDIEDDVNYIERCLECVPSSVQEETMFEFPEEVSLTGPFT